MSPPTQLEFVTLDVFTATKYEGNPLAVVRIPRGVAVSQEQKQAIAREFNLSEATFLHEGGDISSENAWTVDIFLTTAEIPFAGHPTIGTACYALARVARERGIEDGVIDGTFALKAGPVLLRYDVSKKTTRAAIPHDVHIHERRWTRDELSELQPPLAEAHQKSSIALRNDFAIVSIVKGMTFVLVELDDLEQLKLASLAGGSVDIGELDEGWDDTFIGLYFFVRTGHSRGGVVTLQTRMIEGSLEDPATGSAASALTAYLSLGGGSSGETLSYEIVQGVEMGRRSEILIDVEIGHDHKVSNLYLEGGAVQVMEGRLSI